MIKPTNHSSSLHQTANPPGHEAGAEEKTSSEPVAQLLDDASLATSPDVRSILDTLPIVRPERVQAAQRLLASPNYPSAEIIRNIAETFVQSSDPSEAP